MKIISFLSLIFIFLNSFSLFAQEVGMKKYANRNNPAHVAFLYVDKIENPTKFYYREASDKKATLLEVQKNTTDSDDIKILNPKTKEKITIKMDNSFVVITWANGKKESFALESGYIFKSEKIYIEHSPAGIGAMYYMPSPQVPPTSLKITKRTENNQTFFDAIFPNNGGKAILYFEENENKLVVKKTNGTIKTFILIQ